MRPPKPTHAYVGRNQCGCCTAIISDTPDDKEFVAKEVSAVILSGRTIERLTWQVYVDEIAAEPTFMDCPHQPLTPNPYFGYDPGIVYDVHRE